MIQALLSLVGSKKNFVSQMNYLSWCSDDFREIPVQEVMHILDFFNLSFSGISHSSLNKASVSCNLAQLLFWERIMGNNIWCLKTWCHLQIKTNVSLGCWVEVSARSPWLCCGCSRLELSVPATPGYTMQICDGCLSKAWILEGKSSGFTVVCSGHLLISKLLVIKHFIFILSYFFFFFLWDKSCEILCRFMWLCRSNRVVISALDNRCLTPLNYRLDFFLRPERIIRVVKFVFDTHHCRISSRNQIKTSHFRGGI